MADNDETLDVDALLTETHEPAKEQEQTKEEERPEPKTEEQPRDETGKFAPKVEAKAEAKPEPRSEGEPKPEGKGEPEEKDGLVPSWRLREIREERDAELKRRTALETEMATVRQQLQALQKPAEQPKQEDIDPLLDPQGFAKRMKDDFASQLREVQLNSNLAIAHVKHGEKFEKAYNAFLQASQSGDRVSWSQVMNSPNPGEAMVTWHNQRETLKEVGSDPAAYKQKLLEEALKDPAYLAKAIEAAKASAGAQPRQNNVTQLPPSLSRATGTANAPSETELQGVEAFLPQ